MTPVTKPTISPESVWSDQRLVLEALRLLVTQPGYLRPDARDTSLHGYHLRHVDEVLNPIYGSPEAAHREVLFALDLYKKTAQT